ncbi:hypothetical protein ACIGEZ_02225 [Streptomyces sp. NPDC085481]|uniref:hypothetical protein n=1 Tax=Streptomyces sp. NPDC085481 TaxID=3365727 RepID=UPI0037D59A8C
MSAHAIPLTSLLVAFTVTAALAWTAAGHRRGPLAIATGLAAVQGALHLIFGAGEHGGMPGMGMGMGMAGPGMAGPGTAGAEAELPAAVLADPYLTHAAHAAHSAHAAHADHMAHAMDSATTHASGSGSGMLAAHLIAALACGLWLARGEAALFALARTVRARAWAPLRLLLAAVRVLVPALPARRPVRPRRHTRRPHGVVLAHAVSRRGPPRPPAPRATALGALI